MLPDLHTDFSRGRSGDLVLPYLLEFSTVHCDPHSQGFSIVNKAEIDVFLEFSCFFDDPADVGSLVIRWTEICSKKDISSPAPGLVSL